MGNHSPSTPADRAPSRPRHIRAIVGVAGGVVGLGLLGLAVAVTMGAGGRDRAAPGAETRRTLDTAQAEVMDFDITTIATGEIAAAKQLEIRSPLERESTITEIVAEGAAVRAGDVLIRLNDDALRTQLDEESLQLETAKAQVVEADEGYKIQLSENESLLRAAELKLQIAKLELEQWKEGTDKSRRQELEHALERTQKDEQRLREKLDQAKNLFSKGYYSKDQLKQDELAHEKAVAELEKAKLDKAVYHEFEYPKEKQKKESDVTQAEAELERATRQANSKKTSKEADLRNKQRSLQIREDKYKKCKAQVDSAILRAPTDGLVVYASSMQSSRWGWGGDQGPLQIGSKVYPNQELIVLPDTSEMIASVRIHESLASQIKKGQSATVKVDALGGERFQGRVDSIGILAEQTSRWMDPNLREYTVKIALDIPKGPAAPAPAPVDLPAPSSASAPEQQASAEPAATIVAASLSRDDTASQSETKTDSAPAPVSKAGPTHRLKPSMRCEAEVLIDRVAGALAVPIQAVFNEGPLRYIHVPDGSRFTRRPVLVGRRSDRYAEIKAGLSTGDRVLVRKPAPGEIIARPWEAKELAAVGLRLNEQGQVVAAPRSGSDSGGPGDRPPTVDKPGLADTAASARPAGVGS